MHLRLEKGVDRKNLAIEAGVEEEEIAAYEEGDEAVPASLLLILAHSLNVHPGYFFNE
jgi:transcriptional regulator with XRE-family HTH domain